MKDNDLKEKGFIVTTSELCEILNLSSRRIQQLTKEDALIRAAHGKYDLTASIQAYIKYMNEVPNEELNKTEEEALWTRARRQKAELELQIMKGDLHRSDDVKRVMNNMLSSFRSRILSIPSKSAGPLQGKTDFNEIKGILKNAVYEALAELADYDPYVFYAESKDKLSIEDEDSPVEVEQVDEEIQDGIRTKKKK
ncbi:hypothetical protein [Lentibacillus sp. Marseille-P4043]|uniref:hypothetical protein n=1 Tax=Lentibacillus sp. Marseille-P4043 TaxID=2040293 RepID=UPI0018F8A50B|nr:hypothetical protein [Lentibacillus sp. Marseille-P4043]